VSANYFKVLKDVFNRLHKILTKTIGEMSVHILGYTNTNYPVDDFIWIQH